MRTESPGGPYLALPDGPVPFPGVVVCMRLLGLYELKMAASYDSVGDLRVVGCVRRP